MPDGESMADGPPAVDAGTDMWSYPPRKRNWRRQFRVVAIVGLGGGLGTLARYGVELTLPAHPGGFPLGTFVINLTGSLCLGFLMVFLLEGSSPHRYLRPFLAVGFLGGYTTFSAYAAEARGLLARGAWAVADSYVVDSLLAGLAAVWLGATLARVLRGQSVRPGRRRNGR